MAIEKRYEDNYSYYTLVCDHCGDESGHFDDFYEAVEEKKNYGFQTIKENGVWSDLCESCAEQHNSQSSAASDFAGLGG